MLYFTLEVFCPLANQNRGHIRVSGSGHIKFHSCYKNKFIKKIKHICLSF